MEPGLNPLQALIAEHLANTGETLAHIAARGGLPRQTVSGLLNRTHPTGIPRRATLEKLAAGLGLSADVVLDAAARAASDAGTAAPQDHRVTVLIDLARSMPSSQVDVLLATARALSHVQPDTP